MKWRLPLIDGLSVAASRGMTSIILIYRLVIKSSLPAREEQTRQQTAHAEGKTHAFYPSHPCSHFTRIWNYEYGS